VVKLINTGDVLHMLEFRRPDEYLPFCGLPSPSWGYGLPSAAHPHISYSADGSTCYLLDGITGTNIVAMPNHLEVKRLYAENLRIDANDADGPFLQSLQDICVWDETLENGVRTCKWLASKCRRNIQLRLKLDFPNINTETIIETCVKGQLSLGSLDLSVSSERIDFSAFTDICGTGTCLSLSHSDNFESWNKKHTDAIQATHDSFGQAAVRTRPKYLRVEGDSFEKMSAHPFFWHVGQSELTGTEAIVLRGLRLCAEDCVLLRKALSQSQVRSFYISDCTVPDVASFILILASLPALDGIRISNLEFESSSGSIDCVLPEAKFICLQGLRPEFAWSMESLLGEHTEHLSITDCRLSGSHLRQCRLRLRGCSRIRHLSLNDVDFAEEILNSLPNPSKLAFLSVRNSAVSGSSLRQFFAQTGNMKVLDIRESGLGLSISELPKSLTSISLHSLEPMLERGLSDCAQGLRQVVLDSSVELAEIRKFQRNLPQVLNLICPNDFQSIVDNGLVIISPSYFTDVIPSAGLSSLVEFSDAC